MAVVTITTGKQQKPMPAAKSAELQAIVASPGSKGRGSTPFKREAMVPGTDIWLPCQGRQAHLYGEYLSHNQERQKRERFFV